LRTMNNRLKLDKLLKIIAGGESETVEFNASFNRDVIETAVAFANTRGGTIIIGVSDDGVVVGPDFGKEALRDCVNRIAVATEPSVIPDAENFSGGFRIKFMQSEQTIGEVTGEVTGPSNVPLNVPLNEKIFDVIQGTPGIQRKDLAAMFHIAEKTAGRYIANLVAAGKIERRGSKKTGGYWPL
jgi:predicted HTH transcriptional regulator